MLGAKLRICVLGCFLGFVMTTRSGCAVGSAAGHNPGQVGSVWKQREVKQFAQGHTTHTKHLVPEPTFSAII